MRQPTEHSPIASLGVSAKSIRKAGKSKGNKEQDDGQGVENALIAALTQALGHDQPIPLVKTGRDRGLFQTRSGANKKAIEQSIDPATPFVDVVRTDGSGKDLCQLVRLNENGLRKLVAATPVSERITLWNAAARSHKQRIEHIILDQIRFELEQIRFEQHRLSERKDALHSIGIEFISAQLDTLNRERQRTHDAILAAEECRSILAKAVQSQLADVSRHVRDTPSLDASLDFQRDLSEELVYAWQDSSSDEVHMQLERVLVNVGLEKVGSAGQRVGFDGTLHVANDAVLPDEEVEIILPGWRLTSARGKYLIARARVKSMAGSKE